MSTVAEALQRNEHDHLIDARVYPDLMFEDRQVLAREVKRLRGKLKDTRGHLRHGDHPFYAGEFGKP